MRTTIRQSTFETNSSSVHAFVFLSEDDYRRFCNNEVALDLRKIQNDHGDWIWEENELDGTPYLLEAYEARSLINERLKYAGASAYKDNGVYDPTYVEVFFHADEIGIDYENDDEGTFGVEFDYMA